MEILKITALSSKVLVVTVQRTEGWCAYIDAVDGEDHQIESRMVLARGTKLPEAVARAIHDVEGDYIP